MTLKKRLCEHLCPYYKPAKNDELSCRGMYVVERLLKDGEDIFFQKPDKVLAEGTEDMLVKHMCITCPFYEKDCDFIEQGKNSPPCGGFILLGQLLESDSISINDIIRNIS
jgi:hypothetical protein